ncbi:MAG: chromate transporter, partial [Pseudomonadota bacterium]|nr:chromate transporter [Pseudomonadota bacterium]
MTVAAARAEQRSGFLEILAVFTKLGVTSFGGPIAHLGYFRAEFVERRRWLTESNFVDLVALAQFLPGPASSQAGFAIGLMRGGYAGGLAAWLGFTLPSALLLLAFAYGAGSFADTAWGAGLLHGLKLVAVAIVAQAVLGMARSLCPDRPRATIAVAAMIVLLLLGGSLGQVAAILSGGVAGLIVCRAGATHAAPMGLPISRGVGAACLVAYFAL